MVCITKKRSMRHERHRRWLLPRVVCLIAYLTALSVPAAADWLSLCPSPSLSDPPPAGYLSHILGSQQQVILLRIDAEPAEEPGCQNKELSVTRGNLLWAGFANAAVGRARRIGLLGKIKQQGFKIEEILNIDGAIASDKALVTPSTKPTSLHRPAKVYDRAAWFWSPSIWLNMPHRILEAQGKFGLRRIYISLSFSEQRVDNAAQLRQFLTMAHSHGLQIWAVLGDPHAVLDDQRPYFLSLARAIESFNSRPGGVRLDGLQLDIEPYLLPGYQLNPGLWLAKQAETVAAVKLAAPSLPLDMVIPYWLAPDQQQGGELLASVEDDITSLTVMNYRTDPGQIYAFAEKFLTWGKLHKKPVSIALETMPMADQELRVYKQAKRGELWQIDFPGAKVLLLLKQAQDLSGAKAYKLSHSREIDGTKTSFFGSPEMLQSLVRDVENQFAEWPSFAGVALHGLDH
jgi:hypothetical protein